MKRFTAMILMMTAAIVIFTGCSGSKGVSGNTDKIIIGIDDKFAPLGFRDDKNEIVGFDIDLAKAAVEKMGAAAQFQPIDWKTKESELISGRIDLIWNGYTINDERKEKVLFTKPYLENAQVVVTLAKSELTKLDDLADKNVGLQAQSSAADALSENAIQSKIKKVTEYSDNVLALSDLKIGRVDAVIIDEVVINYYMSKEEGTFKLLDDALAPEEYGIGVKKGNEALLEKLQKALDELNQDGTAAKISEKWFGEDKVLK